MYYQATAFNQNIGNFATTMAVDKIRNQKSEEIFQNLDKIKIG